MYNTCFIYLVVFANSSPSLITVYTVRGALLMAICIICIDFVQFVWFFEKKSYLFCIPN